MDRGLSLILPGSAFATGLVGMDEVREVLEVVKSV